MSPRPHLALLLLIGILSACSDSNNDNGDEMAPPPAPEPPPANTADFDVTLGPEQVVGGASSSGSATGEMTVNLDDGTVSGTLTVADFAADAVALHSGFAGDTGGALVELEESSGDEWAFPEDAMLAAGDLDALQAGGLYLEATSEADGAIRGQILPEGIDVLFARLSGVQEVPPLESDASADAALTLDTSDGGIVLHLNTSGLDDASESHIHQAAAGVNGPIIIGLVRDTEDPSHWSIDEFTLEPEQLDALNAGDLYVNVHTPEHPGGEVRAQLEPGGVDVFFAGLTGDEVVPPTGSDGTGVAAGTLAADSGSLSLHVNLVGLDDAEAVDVRQAPVMQNGPVAFSLEQDPNELTHWFAEDLALSNAQQEALINQGLYVTVATPDFPDGEVRGQLAPDTSTPGGGDTFVVTAVDPADGATVDALPASIQVTFNRDLLAESAGAEQVNVSASGGDGSFGDGNEVAVGVVAVNVSGATLTADLDTNAAADDVYEVVLDGSSGNPLTDTAGVVLDGDGDGSAGGDFSSTFTVAAGTSAPTLSSLQADIFTPSCAKSACHAGPAPAQGMNLSDGQTFANVVGVPSLEVPSLNRVEPGDPDNSYLVHKVEGTASSGGRMPLDGPPFLSSAQIQDIRDWIAAGAEDN